MRPLWAAHKGFDGLALFRPFDRFFNGRVGMTLRVGLFDETACLGASCYCGFPHVGTSLPRPRSRRPRRKGGRIRLPHAESLALHPRGGRSYFVSLLRGPWPVQVCLRKNKINVSIATMGWLSLGSSGRASTLVRALLGPFYRDELPRAFVSCNRHWSLAGGNGNIIKNCRVGMPSSVSLLHEAASFCAARDAAFTYRFFRHRSR